MVERSGEQETGVFFRMDKNGLTKNRKRGRSCSICEGDITLWSMYRISGKRSLCSNCFFNPPTTQKGILNEDSEGLQQCHVCHMYFSFLGSHISGHGYTADEYKEEFGLSRQTSLMSRERRGLQSKVARINQERGVFPDGEFGKRMLEEFRKKGSKTIMTPRLQERLKRSEQFKENNPMSKPSVKRRHLRAIRRRKTV